MEKPRVSLRSVPAIVATVVWGLFGIYLVVMEVIEFFKIVGRYPSLMDVTVVGFFVGLTWIASAFLQWHKKNAVRIVTNIYLLLISLLLVPIFMVGAASAHSEMSMFQKVFPWFGVILSILCIVIRPSLPPSR